MKFYEYKAHEILRKYGIPVPRGVLASKPEDIVDLPLPAAVKAQVLIGGRGKAGGIKFAKTAEEAREAARLILGMTIGPYTVKQVYAQEMLDIAQELYLSISIDRSARARLPKETASQVSDIARKAFALFEDEDAELVEINPLAVLKDGRVMAGDAKLVVDDNAEYRHPEYAELPQDRTPLEEEAHDKGITFIQLDGDIGVIANGAGLTMATLDVLNLKGGKGGAFLDLGGTDDPEKVKQAFEILLKARPSAQGITGHQGQFHTRAMLDYGTKVVAGTSPGKGGTTVEGVPVFDSCFEAVDATGANTSIGFVPAPD